MELAVAVDEHIAPERGRDVLQRTHRFVPWHPKHHPRARNADADPHRRCRRVPLVRLGRFQLESARRAGWDLNR
eukprot:2692438-Pleurochrysis_carterae.AAC.1